MKKIIYTFLLIITFLIICNFAFLSCSKKNVSDTSNPNVIDSNVNSKFEINILSNKNEYYQLEPVWMTIQIKNTSPNVDSIDIHDNIELLPGFRVTDKNGNELIYHYNLGLYGRPNFIKINGNGQISFDVELSMGFGENNLGEHLRAKYYPITYFSKGKYSVTLHYRKALNKEMLQSNKINFEVKLPENDELKVFKKDFRKPEHKIK